MSKTWTKNNVELIKQLHSEGKTCVQMGKEMGLSRSCIVSKCHHLGLELNGYANPDKHGGLRVIKTHPRVFLKADALWQAEAPGPHSVTIWHLKSNTCRWPLWATDGTPEEKFYCGEEPEGGSRYCARHRQIYARGY